MTMNKDNAPKQITKFMAFCNYCGNMTYNDLVASHGSHRLYKCQICSNVTLQRALEKKTERTTRRGRTVTDVEETLEQLWPPISGLPPEVPERVRSIYEEARSIKSKSPSSFVVQIRRALEAVAKDHKAPGKALYEQVEWLIKNNYLPETFGKMVKTTRMFGNLGAHDAEKDVKPTDTDLVDEFFRATIEYLYIAPAKVARVTTLIGKK